MQWNAIRSTNRPGFEAELCVSLFQQSNPNLKQYSYTIVEIIKVMLMGCWEIKFNEMMQWLAHSMCSIKHTPCPPLIQAAVNHLGIDLIEKSWTRRKPEVCRLQLSSVSSLVVQNLNRISSSSNCLGEAVWVGMNHLLDAALCYTDVLQDCMPFQANGFM